MPPIFSIQSLTPPSSHGRAFLCSVMSSVPVMSAPWPPHGRLWFLNLAFETLNTEIEYNQVLKRSIKCVFPEKILGDSFKAPYRSHSRAPL